MHKIGDIIKLKRNHACGENCWEVLRIGTDIKLRCCKCHRIITLGQAQYKEQSLENMVKQSITENVGLDENIKKSKNWIRKVTNPSIETMKEAILENAMSIRFIENPPDEIIKVAIDINPLCIQFIDASIENQKLALEKNLSAIQFIKNPSEEIVEYAKKIYTDKMKNYFKNEKGMYVRIKNFDGNVEDVNLLPEDEILRLLQQNGKLISLLEKPTDEMIRAAVKKSPEAIRFLKKPSRNILRDIVELSPKATTQYVLNELGEIVEKTKEQEKDIFHMVMDELTLEEKLTLKNPEIFKYMNDIPYELQLAAVKKNYLNLRWISPIHPRIFDYLYEDENFNVYSLYDDFSLQVKIVTAFEKIKNQRDKGQYKKDVLADENVTTEIVNTWERMKQEAYKNDFSMKLIDSNKPIDTYLNEFASKIDVDAVNIASGFVYKSGLKQLEPLFRQIYAKEGKIRIIVGSLKNYYLSSTDNKLVNIDLDTARELNIMITQHGSEVYTFENRFYHGKYYMLFGKEWSCCLIGSSNLTSSGFRGNYELNTLYLVKNGTGYYEKMSQWYDEFLMKCTQIDMLSECNFTDTSMNFDTIMAGTNIVSANVSDIKAEIQELSDEETKFRLNLWLSKNPNNIYRQLDIENLKAYVAFEFKENQLIVFESFESGNGYYYFYSDNIFEVVQKVKSLTKTEIFNLSNMDRRGYHIKDREVLQNKINSLFKKR